MKNREKIFFFFAVKENLPEAYKKNFSGILFLWRNSSGDQSWVDEGNKKRRRKEKSEVAALKRFIFDINEFFKNIIFP